MTPRPCVTALSMLITVLAFCRPTVAQLDPIGVVTDGDIASITTGAIVTGADAFDAFSPLLTALGVPAINIAAIAPNITSGITSGVTGIISPSTWTPFLTAAGVTLPAAAQSALAAFNLLVNGAVGNVTQGLIQTLFFTPAGTDRALQAALIGLPNPAEATPRELQIFSQRFLKALTTAQQQSATAVGRLIKQGARATERYQKETEKACADWATSKFLRSFADLLLALGQPYGSVFDLLSQVAGVVFSGQSITGQQYLDAFCCDLVKKSGVNLTLATVNLVVGADAITLDELISLAIDGDFAEIDAFLAPALPGAAADDPTATAAATTRSSGSSGTTAKPSAHRPPPARKSAEKDAEAAFEKAVQEEAARQREAERQAALEALELPPQVVQLLRALQGSPGQCNAVEWVVYALQNDEQLARAAVRLLKALLNLTKRLLVGAIRSSNKIGSRAASRLVDAQQGFNKQVLGAVGTAINAAGH